MTKAIILHVILLASQPYAHDFTHPTFAETLTAIVWQESSFCRFDHSRIDSHANGCGGLHQGTAELVAGTKVSVWMLRHSKVLNIELSARYLHLCAQTYHFNWYLSVECYHLGVPSTKRMSSLNYVLAIRRRLHEH